MRGSSVKAVNLIVLAMATLALPAVICANDITVEMHAVTDSGISESIGVVVIRKVAHGVEFRPALFGLTPGEHGFHVHEYSSCEPAMDDEGELAAALSAGDHYDPEATQQHDSPLSNDGHKGDLPVLVADASGRANTPVQAARLSMADLESRALIVHVGGDNYSDSPEPLGGGGDRVACGLINP
jgi:superoxide dismutase, Cu-Zn family